MNITHTVTEDLKGIASYIESVDNMIEVIKEKGLEVESGPFQPNPHIKFFNVKDPNGVSIQFVENM